jgi:Mg-chelatase subunit ChlD
MNVHMPTQQGLVYLLIDCSDSMTGYKLNQAKLGILHFAKHAIKKNYLIGLIKFDSYVTHICEPVQDLMPLEHCLIEMHTGGSTNMADAIKMAYAYLRGRNCSRAIVIATDGKPDNAKASLAAGKQLLDDGIDIFAIGTDDADQTFLEKLASRLGLGIKVNSNFFAKAIADVSKLLPEPSMG